MRFDPEFSDPANMGITIILDLLEPVKRNHPELSYADLWSLGGVSAIEFAGGPKIPHCLGRTDAPNGSYCPENGRLPDASQGAEHLRDVFYRMGLSDRDIVALSGGHTLGRCHLVRSGYDGPWTKHPFRFDNAYFRNLMNLTWREKKWDGPTQFEDVESGELMMLPTDMAIKTDPKFRVYAQLYADDEDLFFRDFAISYAKLLSLGTNCVPQIENNSDVLQRRNINAKYREAAMHGSVDVVKRLSVEADVHELESISLRSALHKAAFWGHIDTVKFLVNELGLDVNGQDYNGDTALHDACRFGHESVVEFLVSTPSQDLSIRNKNGQSALDIAISYRKQPIVDLIKNRSKL
jgi:catalase (peroxidase I)